ncbi:cytochrome P450 3A5 [Podospora didyma]|uniref:Cytochrome P450 3A5 n=1 Tax=Podospora didyma TaxID=330526 RepID=A0AAE0NXC4_9PEZI|nr:cytochrome P450 3A5 [Podospora didyma]
MLVWKFTALASLVETAVWIVGSSVRGGHGAATQAFALRTFLACFALQYGAIKLYWAFIYPFFRSPLRHLPGPKNNIPLIGQLKNLLTASSPVELYVKWGNTWPDAPFIRHLGIGNAETLLVNTPEAHKEVLQTYCYSFQKPELFSRYIGEIVGRGLLFVEGNEHKRQRRILQSLFSVPSIKRILPVFHEKAKSLISIFEKKLDENGRANIEAVEYFSKMTIDVVGVTILGVELNNLSPEDRELDFLSCYHRVFNQSAFGSAIGFINVFIPIRWLPLKANKCFIEANNELRRLVRQCVHQRVKDLANGTSSPRRNSEELGGRHHGDLLTLMVEERKQLGDKADLTEEDMVGHLLTFTAAGYETTAGAMMWASYVLATNPEVQDKLRAEILPLFEDNPNAKLELSDIEKLSYMHNFCREVLRIHAPAVSTYREAKTDLTICGEFIPKGTTMLLVPAVTGLSKNVWGDDADEFKPERWNALHGDAASPYAFNPFGGGPRICIGRQFALCEFKILLLEVVRHFRLLPSPELESLEGKLPEIDNPAVAYKPKGGVNIVLERIW